MGDQDTFVNRNASSNSLTLLLYAYSANVVAERLEQRPSIIPTQEPLASIERRVTKVGLPNRSFSLGNVRIWQGHSNLCPDARSETLCGQLSATTFTEALPLRNSRVRCLS